MMKPSCVLAIIPVVALVTAGCSQAPTDTLAAAEASVNEAVEAGAPAYALDDFLKLQAMLTAAKAELAEQESKVAFLRDYERAEQLFANVTADAMRVSAITAKKKEDAKASSALALHSAHEAVKKVRDLVSAVPAGVDRTVLREIKTDLEGLIHSLSEAQAAVDSGDYQAAQANAHVIQDKSRQAASEVERAPIRTSRVAPAKKK